MTPSLSRRRFLKAAAVLAAAANVPLEVAEAALAAEPSGTTLDRTIMRLSESGYSTLGFGPGERHEPHPDNPVPVSGDRNRVLAAFVHFTDVHVIDAQSPLRVEWMTRMACGPAATLKGAHRPQETMTTQVLSSMVRAVNDVQTRRIAAGQRALDFAVSTGDNTDNQQKNEIDWFISGMDGVSDLRPNSGDDGYEGVQVPEWGAPFTQGGDSTYWRPRAGTTDVYKAEVGFPDEDAWGYGPDGLLTAATRAFSTPPLTMPWYSTYGNHDGLLQGNMPDNEFFRQWGVGELKTTGPPVNFDPCHAFADPEALFQGPAAPITPDEGRIPLSRRQYIEAHLASGDGHGYTPEHAEAGAAYYTLDTLPGFRFVMLDTVNPGGYAQGSIGETQLNWLAERIAEASDRYVILFSHHGLHSLDNPLQAPDPDGPEPERRVLADEIEAMLHEHPNVIAWVAGHTHQNRVTLRSGNDHSFWDIETAAHIDWPCQNRIIEVVDAGDALVLRTTILDHAAPVRRSEISATGDPTLKVAGVHREVAANDPQFDRAEGAGPAEARNVELTLPKPPLDASGAADDTGGRTTTGDGGTETAPAVAGQDEERRPLPATGGAGFQLAAMLAAAGAIGMRRFADRVRDVQAQHELEPPG